MLKRNFLSRSFATTARFFCTLLITIIGIFLSFSCAAQFFDDFTDGDLTNDVVWVGDLTNFTIVNNELALNATGGGMSTLSTVYAPDDSLRYGLDLRLEFGPSNDNQFRWYLYHEHIDSDSAAALYLEIGESGSADAFTLIQRDEYGTETMVMRFGSIPHTTSELKVGLQIDYFGNSNWAFAFDHQLDGTIDELTSVIHPFFLRPSGFYGLRCKYTGSRADRFFFNRAFIEKIIPDRIPPAITALSGVSLNKINIFFNEAINGTTISPAQFELNPGNRMPDSVFWDQNNPTTVCLVFDVPLLNETEYQLRANLIEDAKGNTANTLEGSVLLRIPQAVSFGDIIINEIHAAPSTATLVANTEFVELFNRSDKIIDLAELEFRDASGGEGLPSRVITGGDYVIVTDADDVHLFDTMLIVIGMSDFPSLNNGGDQLVLSNQNSTIDQVNYSSTWYGNPDKTSGWSLECKNPDSRCRGQLNWAAAIDPTGGTPGEINSLFSAEEPPGAAIIDRVRINSSVTVDFIFNIEMDADQLGDLNNFVVSPTIEIQSVLVLREDGLSVLRVIFDELMTQNQVYTITFNTEICACNGQKWPAPYAFSFGLGEEPQVGDIRISEILYAPFTDEAEFIELYNASGRIINAGELWMHIKFPDNKFEQKRINADFQLLPDKYYVLTSNVNSVVNNYDVPFPGQVKDYDLPALTNDGGVITLFRFDSSQDSVFIDDAAYNSDFHDPLLDRTNGISLERIVIAEDGLVSSNWYSASTLAGGATPTGQNSQRIIAPDPGSSPFQLVSETFSPDGDGFEDLMVLRYGFDEPGYIAQARVFGYDGAPVAILLNNVSLGTEGQIIWNGQTSEGNLARVGIYYVVIKAFQVGGNVIEDKIKIILARQ